MSMIVLLMLVVMLSGCSTVEEVPPTWQEVDVCEGPVISLDDYNENKCYLREKA